MRAVLILVAAVMFGLAGGYAWSVMSAPQAHVHVPKVPKSNPLVIPESATDHDWETRSEDKPTPPPSARDSEAVERNVHYAGCNEVRAAGKGPLYAGQPGYSEDMDGDGIACEPKRGG